MALTILATPGSATANSFATVPEADAYIEGRLNAGAWNDEADVDKRKAALIEATRDLSAREWRGMRTTDTQALSWPRLSAPDPDSPTKVYYADDVIPQRVKNATIELALEFLRAGTTDVAALDRLAGIKRKKVDVLETEYTASGRPTGLARFPRVLELLEPLLDWTQGSIGIRLVRS